MSFEASAHSYGAYGAGGEPPAPGSNQAAYDAASYWLDHAAHAATSYVTKARLFALAAEAKAKAVALDHVPGGKLLYGDELAILLAAAHEIPPTVDATAFSRLLALQGGVLAARAAAQSQNPLYKAEKVEQKAKEAVSWLPWLAGGAVVLGGLALAGRPGRQNPADSWLAIAQDEFAGSLRDSREGFRDLQSLRQTGDYRGFGERAVGRAVRQATHADTAGRIFGMLGLW